jgi:e3 binding domain
MSPRRTQSQSRSTDGRSRRSRGASGARGASRTDERRSAGPRGSKSEIQELGVDVDELDGSGAEGRITVRDVRDAGKA